MLYMYAHTRTWHAAIHCLLSPFNLMVIVDTHTLWRRAVDHITQSRATTEQSRSTRSPSPAETLPPGYTSSAYFHLPGYSYYPRPERPLIYTFSEWASDSMYLMSPIDAPSYFPVQGPMYAISAMLSVNPLVPVSCVTTVRRASGDTGSLIGRFEISLNQKRELVSFCSSGYTSKNLADMLRPINRSDNHWLWASEDVTLRWDCRSNLDDGTPVCNCYSVEGDYPNQLASFVPQPLQLDMEIESDTLPPAILTIWPDGHQYLDDILFSILIIERKRTIVY